MPSVTRIPGRTIMLIAAHRGYEYQDLLVACRLVDMLLGEIAEAYVDHKLVADDRFDDLTVVTAAGIRERCQFKHTENGDRPLSLATFTTDARSLRLDHLFASMLADRAGPGRGAAESHFRIVLRDAAPDDEKLKAVLRPIGAGDPGPFVPRLGTVRLRFDSEALWAQRDGLADGGREPAFAFCSSESTALTRTDIDWACSHLLVEVGAPAMSADLTAPDAAERIILERMSADVGAGAYPNVDRSSADVAAAMISTARAARQGRLVVSADELLRRAQLRTDFGSVTRSYPVDPDVEVARPSAVGDIVAAAAELATVGGHLVIVGPPGQGKSWVSQQVCCELGNSGWITAEHYCYLGDADGERTERVLSEAVFGSLLGRLAAADPRLVLDQRPRFAADEEALESSMRRSLALAPDRRVALIVDGIDHITRVRAGSRRRFDPSKSLAEAFASLTFPPGCVLIVLSQPGAHLDPLQQGNFRTLTVPALDRKELAHLVRKLHVLPQPVHTLAMSTASVEDADLSDRFLDALSERTAGNALYATYVCREIARDHDALIDQAERIRRLPAFDGTLKAYYDHLSESLGLEAGWVADVIALIGFSVTRAELRQLRPDGAHRVDHALDLLSPVLVERATQGGVRIYHESFARYLRGAFDKDPEALRSLLLHIATWLQDKGVYTDARAFRSLLPILAEAGEHRRLIELVDREFVVSAVANGFPASAIKENLSTAIGSAALLGEWPMIIRCVELSRAADSYQSERFDSTLVSFADVPSKVVGVDTVASRLLDEERLVMPARAGLQMCAAVDRLGANAPWRAYMLGHLKESKHDNTAYGDGSDQAVALAWLRGRLRLASARNIGASEGEAKPGFSNDGLAEDNFDLSSPIIWERLGHWIEENTLPMQSVVSAVIDTHGSDGFVQLLASLQKPGEACLAYAESLEGNSSVEAIDDLSPRFWGIAAAAHGVNAGSVHRLLRLGVAPALCAHGSTEDLVALTRRVQERSVRFENEDLATWLDRIAVAAFVDVNITQIAELSVVGEGWYRWWLRFALSLVRAEAAQEDRCQLAFDALQLLERDLRPFVGDPRACDLYPIHGEIRDTIVRAMRLLDDTKWELGIQLLRRVSDGISTTLFGELNGPVAADFVLRLAVEGATASRQGAARALVSREIEEGSARRYYSDLAEYRLYSARLDIAVGDLDEARRMWRETCSFLTAYGFHKDITIFELLEPLPALIEADARRGRRSVATVQGLCERVPLHTDRKETRWTWSRWWGLLAKADPVGTVNLAVVELLKKCNDPNSLLNGAVDDVWEEWHDSADPLLSALLRLALGKSLDKRDASVVRRLAEDVTVEKTLSQRLSTWLLARADERPTRYSYSNSAELLEKDDELVVDLNSAGAFADAPPVVPIREVAEQPLSSSPSKDGNTERAQGWLGDHIVPSLPPGLPGLDRAIREWRRRPYAARSPRWEVERFANAVGYRLLELVSDGRLQDAESALRVLGDAIRFGEGAEILRSVGEGLERHGESRLAAFAYTLTWTRSRGGGGWMSFGGEKCLDALQSASRLDSGTAISVIADEIERVVAGNGGTYGITQAIILAFASKALVPPGRQSIDEAFRIWDEAFAVIAARAPRVADDDDPDLPYCPPASDAGESAPGDLNEAFALAVLGTLFHPSRERKRRGLLATQQLLRYRPKAAAQACRRALPAISDPATLTWLLHLIESEADGLEGIIEECQPALRELVARDHLTIRALARRLLIGSAEVPLAPSQPSQAISLLGASEIWIPNSSEEAGVSRDRGLEKFVETAAENRLRRGERRLPNFRQRVRAFVASTMERDETKKRMESQLDSLMSRVNRRWPDAVLVGEEVVEATLQSVAASGRADMFAMGQLVIDPIQWEDDLASALLNDPTFPLLLEATRQPRPSIPFPPGSTSFWKRLRDCVNGTADPDFVHASEEDGLFAATVSVKPLADIPAASCGALKGWQWLATVEQRWIKSSDWQNEKDLIAKRYRVVEIRDAGDVSSLALPPVATGDLRLWRAQVDGRYALPYGAKSQPLVGVDTEVSLAGDVRAYLGVPPAVVTPTPRLIASLRLQPSDGCAYSDSDGIGLTLVTWSAEYDTSDYELTRPRTTGSGILIRPDLLEKLAQMAGESRLLLRDYLWGDAQLAAPAPTA